MVLYALFKPYSQVIIMKLAVLLFYTENFLFQMGNENCSFVILQFCNFAFQSLYFNEVAGLRPATLLRKKLWHRCFPVNFAKFLRTTFFTEQLRWLLLDIQAVCTQVASNICTVFHTNVEVEDTPNPVLEINIFLMFLMLLLFK